MDRFRPRSITRCYLVLTALIASVVTGCSNHQVEQGRTLSVARVMPLDGSVSVAGPVPALEPLSALVESAHALGFVPAEAFHDGKWLSIDSKSNTVRLMDGQSEIRSGPVAGASLLRPGTFAIQHKQRGALWYAPDQYFSSRGLKVPGTGERGRYLRGALGDFSLFIDKNTPIHSGPVESREIGGIRAEENLLSEIYYSLDVGAPIEVR